MGRCGCCCNRFGYRSQVNDIYFGYGGCKCVDYGFTRSFNNKSHHNHNDSGCGCGNRGRNVTAPAFRLNQSSGFNPIRRVGMLDINTKTDYYTTF